MLRCFLLVFWLTITFGFAQAGCPYGTVTSPYDGAVCYAFASTPESFYRASQTCFQRYGGDLASIPDGFVNSFISTSAHSALPSKAKFWVGAIYRSKWIWTDATVWGYQNWGNRVDIDGACLSMASSNGLWYSEECISTKPAVCQFRWTNDTITQSTVTLPTTTSSTIPDVTTSKIIPPMTSSPSPQFSPRPPFSCTPAPKNLFLTYFMDAGTTSSTIMTWYQSLMTFTTAKVVEGTATLQLYAANGKGESTSRKPLNSLQLGYDVLTLLTEYSSVTSSSLIPALTNYQTAVPTQLTYSATPVVAVFLINPIADIDQAIAQMLAMRAANPTSYFYGFFLADNPDYTKLPWDGYMSLNGWINNDGAQAVALDIFNFACV